MSNTLGSITNNPVKSMSKIVPMSSGSVVPVSDSESDSDDVPISLKYCTACTTAVRSTSNCISIDVDSGHYNVYCDDCLESGFHKKNEDFQPLEIRGTVPEDNTRNDTKHPSPIVRMWNSILNCFRRLLYCFFGN